MRNHYVEDTPLVPLENAAVGNSASSTSAAGAKNRSRPNNEYILYSYGEPIAMTADGNASYFGTDILGSVRNVTDKYGNVQSNYNYDVFGSPYLSNLDHDIGFGYCGKIYDNGTGLYDYGFRDYSPNQARFTTVDPIRDGANWFSYVVNDPVNYIDPFGLTPTDSGQDKYKSDPSEPLTTGGSVEMYSAKREALIKKNTTSAVDKAIENHKDDKYSYGTKENNYTDHYRCDNFDEAVINEAGGNSTNYMAGKASEKNVQQHIDNYMKNNGTEYKKTDAPVLDDGSYVVYMNKSNIIDKKTGEPLAPHAGMIISENSGIRYIDNNGGNETKGVQEHKFDTTQEFQTAYGYQSFYYQEIHIENPKNLTTSEINKNKQQIEEMFQ